MSSCEICRSKQDVVDNYCNRALRRDRMSLCMNCNNALIRFGEDVEALGRVVSYLNRYIVVEIKRCADCDAELFSTGHCPWQCERKIDRSPDAST